MGLAVSPMSVGDIFDRLVKLIGKTTLRNVIVALVIVAPAAAVFTFGIDAFLTTVLQVAEAGESMAAADPESLANLGGAFAVFFISLFLFGLAMLTAALGITIISCGEITGQRFTWNEALNMTFDIRLLHVLGQVVLQYLAIASLLSIPFLIIVVGSISKSLVVGALGGFLFVPAILFSIHLAIRWALTLPILAWENTGVVGSFRRSGELVSGRWWRTFGVLFLLTVVAQFAISIITTPVSFIALWDFLAAYFAMMGNLGAGEPDPRALLASLGHFGIGMGVVSFVSAILSLLITPLATTVVYFDLRARNGEFMQPAASGTYSS